MQITMFNMSWNSNIFRSKKSLLRNHMMTYQIFDSGIGYSDIMFVYGNNAFQMSIGSGF